jgi:hypothetical protein
VNIGKALLDSIPSEMPISSEKGSHHVFSTSSSKSIHHYHVVVALKIPPQLPLHFVPHTRKIQITTLKHLAIIPQKYNNRQ